MKNCLAVVLVLVASFAVAVYLVLFLPHGGNARSSGRPYMIATWRFYDDGDLNGLQVTVGTNRMVVDVPAAPQFRQVIKTGHWTAHTFYCDSNLDAPAEISIAHELPNEDLEVDIGHFLPYHPGKITCVKVFRLADEDDRPPYPKNVPGQTVTYPPPKGLIRPGMLECDLEMLPWHADRVDEQPIGVVVNDTVLSDGSHNQPYFPAMNAPQDPNPPAVYTFHSDRPGLPKLLVTVYHGRVTEVTGGAEENDDFPYQFPKRSSPVSAEP